MSLLGRLFNKFCEPDRENWRVQADRLLEDINNPKVKEVKICEKIALLLRRIMAEKLGREVVDTPLPGQYDGTIITVDKSLQSGQIEVIYFEADINTADIYGPDKI